MKKTMKAILRVCVALFVCALFLMACDSGNNLQEPVSGSLPESTPESAPAFEVHNHTELAKRITNVNAETPYSWLYSAYIAAIEHNEEFGCGLNTETLLETMLYGKWSDGNDNYTIKHMFIETITTPMQGRYSEQIFRQARFPEMIITIMSR